MNPYPVSVIMPALNEEENLLSAVKNVTDCFAFLEISGEILIVDDGSADRTGELAETLSRQHPFIKVIHHHTPQGIGASFWDGVKASGGEMVAMIPGDGENDAYEILRYLPLMKHVDLAVPFIYNRGVRSFKRRILSSLYRGIINLSFGMSLNYMNGTVMYRKSVFEGVTLKCSGFFYQTELLVKCVRKGYVYAEVPSALRQRAKGTSKATTLKSLARVARDYLRTLGDVYFSGREGRYTSPESVTAQRWKQSEAADIHKRR